MASSSDVVRPRRRLYCPHCQDNVGHSTYYRHRDMYYNANTNQWSEGQDIHDVDAGDSVSESSSSTSCDGDRGENGLSSSVDPPNNNCSGQTSLVTKVS